MSASDFRLSACGSLAGGMPFGMRALLRPAAVLAALTLLAGCAGGPFSASEAINRTGGDDVVISLTPARVTEVQACAIGYDLARAIHAHVSLRRTVILAPRRASDCERHTLTYLRRAGFRIDEPGGTGARLTIALDRAGHDATGQPLVSAVAGIGGDLRIARPYRLVRTGVIAAGPVSIQHLDPNTYNIREAGS